MAIAAQRAFRTISLPADLADQAEELARRERRPLSDVLQEALENYRARKSDEFWEEIAATAPKYNPIGYTEEDVPRLIKEWRAEQDAKAKSRTE